MTDDRLVSALVVRDGEPLGMCSATYNDVAAARFGFEVALAAGDPVLIRQLHDELLTEVGADNYAEAVQVALLVLVNSVVGPCFDALGEAKEPVQEQFRASANEFYSLTNGN